MHLSDMTGQRKLILQREVISTKHPLLLTDDGFNDEIPYDTPGRDPYMGIDTPSDEFYNIHSTQYVPPMSARHKLQPRLPKPNQSPETFPKKQTKQKWTGPIYLPANF